MMKGQSCAAERLLRQLISTYPLFSFLQNDLTYLYGSGGSGKVLSGIVSTCMAHVNYFDGG